MSHCEPCLDIPGCIFCLSSLECIDGTNEDTDFYCREALNTTESCPVLPLPSCQFYDSCSACLDPALNEGCAWCASTSECILSHDIFALSGCVGALSQPLSCPKPSVPITTVEGDFVVKEVDEVGLGGSFHVEGSCFESDCHKEGRYSFIINNEGIAAQSGGAIILEAADSNNHNHKGSDLYLKSGNGTSPVGGWGGDIQIIAGNGAGGE